MNSFSFLFFSINKNLKSGLVHSSWSERTYFTSSQHAESGSVFRVEIGRTPAEIEKVFEILDFRSHKRISIAFLLLTLSSTLHHSIRFVVLMKDMYSDRETSSPFKFYQRKKDFPLVVMQPFEGEKENSKSGLVHSSWSERTYFASVKDAESGSVLRVEIGRTLAEIEKFFVIPDVCSHEPNSIPFLLSSVSFTLHHSIRFVELMKDMYSDREISFPFKFYQRKKDFPFIFMQRLEGEKKKIEIGTGSL